MKKKIAFLISEVCAPWVTNLWFFLVLGVVTQAWSAAIIAILGTSIMPMTAIRVMTILGKVGGRHVQKREQRYIVFAAIFVLLGAALVGLWQVHTPRIIWVSVLSAVIFIGTFASITRLWCKASIHTGLWVCVTTFLALTVTSLWWMALAMAPVIGWARVVVKGHSWGEVGVGMSAGVAVTVACYQIFLV